MSYLSIECIQGNPEKMSGHLIVYAIVDDVNIPKNLAETVNNKILAVEGDYLNQRDIRDFFRQEFNVSLEKGIEKIIGQVKVTKNVLEEDQNLSDFINPKERKHKIKSIRNIESIPIPAKVVHFDSMEEIKLKQNYDIYFLGRFDSVQYAHLSVNSFPIMYQSRFREQENKKITKEIEDLLNSVSEKEINQDESVEENKHSKQFLLTTLIPNIIYNLSNKQDFEKSKKELDLFLKDYPFTEDIDKLKVLIEQTVKDQSKDFTSIELIVDKIWALQNEDYQTLKKIKGRLQDRGL